MKCPVCIAMYCETCYDACRNKKCCYCIYNLISKLSFISHSFIYHLPTFFNHSHPELISFLWCIFIFRFIILNLLFFNVNKQIRFLSTVTTFLISTRVITSFTIHSNTNWTFHYLLNRVVTYNTLKLVLKLVLFYSLNSFKYGLWHCHFNNLLLTVTKNRLCLRHLYNYEIRLSLMSTQMWR